MILLLVLHFFICFFLVFVILLQPGKGDAGIGFGSSSSQSIFGSKGASNFLTKTTSVCAIVFLATSFFLTRARIMESNPKSVINSTEETQQTAPTPPAAKDAKEAGTKPATPTSPAPTDAGKK